ncbi:MAG: hypothetical protein WC327_06230 [Candidatus Cloacimonadia bacterium]
MISLLGSRLIYFLFRRRIKAALIVLLLLYISFAHAYDLPLQVSANQNATAGLIFLYSTPSNSHYNPAFISNDGIESSFGYLFNLTELPLASLHLAKSYRNYGLFLETSHLAHPYSKETDLQLSLSRHGKLFSSGFALKYHLQNIVGEETGSRLTIDWGLIIYHGRIVGGVSLLNLSHSAFTTYVGELNYQLSEKSSISIGLEKESDFNPSLKLGTHYSLHDNLTLLSSYQLNPDRIGVGLVLQPSRLKLHYGVQTHQYLSLTHMFSISYDLSS